MRSSGIYDRPKCRRFKEASRVMSMPFIRMAPLNTGRRPERASSSSLCPLPVIPAIPNISLPCTEKETFFTASSPRSPMTERFCISMTASPWDTEASDSTGIWTLCPTINVASSSFVAFSRGSVAICFPLRITVIMSEIARTSERL